MAVKKETYEGMIQGDAPQQTFGAASTNPNMQADSAQKTVNNVEEVTAQGGTSGVSQEQDWRAGLKNPNQHLENYGDDSSLPYQEHPETLGGTMSKYEGEGVMTTSGAEIDKNKQLDQLDPNYKYGQESQIYGSEHSGYIQERNDNIATALWNAGIRTPEGIRAWLEKQPGFMNSSEHDRNNTVMSIYKRMGTEPAKQEEAGTPTNTDEGINLQDVGEGRIYGKDTPYEGDVDRGLRTEVDPMNITNLMNASREANVKALASMTPEDIATSIVSGYTPMGDQAYRDLQQFYPSIYAQVQDALKVKRGQKDINSLTTTGTVDATDQTKTDSERIENDKRQWADSVGGEKSESILEQADKDMASNKAASSAEEEMNNCQKDIASLQTRLKNLPKEARSAFKGDVPQYLVNAYVANKSQEIQDQISELQSRYNAAMNLYQTEWEKYKWGKEYDLKKKQLEMQQDMNDYEIWAGKQKIAQGWTELGKNADGTSTNPVVGTGTGNMRTERNNNPTAMTTDVAKSLGMVEGQDYIKGDSFVTKDGKTLYTAKLIGDPIEATIKAFDNAANNPDISIFRTQGGGKRWTYIDMSDEEWLALDHDEKVAVINNMLKNEGGTMSKMAYYNSDNYKPDFGGIYQGILNGEYTTGPAKLVIMETLGVSSWEEAAKQAEEWKRNKELEVLTKDWEDDAFTPYYELSDEDLNKLPDADKERIEKAFGGWENFMKSRKKYVNQVIKPQGVAQGKEVLTQIAELINIFKDAGQIDEDGTLNRNLLNGLKPWDAVYRKVAQMQDALKLEKLIEARNNGATFGSMTEGEWKIIQDAATAFGNWYERGLMTDKDFTKELNNVVRKLWKATYGTDADPSNEEWNNFVESVKNSQDAFDVSTSKKGTGAITREQANELRGKMENADTQTIAGMIMGTDSN